MHWTRIRDDLYDASELARARATRGLPDYRQVHAPREWTRSVVRCARGCGARAHYHGAVCLACRIAESVGRAA